MNPLQLLLYSSGPLLDHAAAALGLPARESVDDTGYVPIMQSDGAYRRALAATLTRIAVDLESKA